MNVQDILFEYLKDVVYNTDAAELDLETLPPEFHKLGQGMQLLRQWILEAKAFSINLAKGNLSQTEADADNVFVAPMKELQGTLRHLTWQTQQIAKGDYSQKVDFMGQFSESFNTMTKQLEEQREALLAEKRETERKNAELKQSFELAQVFANYTHSMIFIHSKENQTEIFKNEAAVRFLEERPTTAQILMNKLQQKDVEGITDSIR